MINLKAALVGPALILGALLLCLGCDDGADDVDGDNAFGRENGAACVLFGSGNPCRGGLCLPFAEAGDRGVCGEPCDGMCRYGGECVRYDNRQVDFERVCVVPCEGGLDSCGDDLACFGVDTLFECEDDRCASDPSERSWCQPTF